MDLIRFASVVGGHERGERGGLPATTDGVVRIRGAEPRDLDFVLAIQAHEDAAPYVSGWSREQHQEAIADAAQAHLVIERDGDPVGFVLLAGLSPEATAVELRRIVVHPKGCGIGRQALALVLDHVFETTTAHRVWLDVMIDNERARRSYQASGFVEEGVLREALLTERGYVSLRVMSILRPEWCARRRSRPPSPV